jgi:hypothetical protein
LQRYRKLPGKLSFPSLTSISGRAPFRARKTIDSPEKPVPAEAQPQGLPDLKLNFRLRNRLPTSKTAVAATMHKETACCQSMIYHTSIQRVRN